MVFWLDRKSQNEGQVGVHDTTKKWNAWRVFESITFLFIPHLIALSEWGSTLRAPGRRSYLGFVSPDFTIFWDF